MKRIMKSVLVTLAMSGLVATTAHAAGLYQLSLMVQNPSNSQYVSSLTVTAGTSYNFEIVGQLQAVTVNGATGNPTSSDGANSASYNITNTGTLGILASNLTVSTSPDNWTGTTLGETPGTAASSTGTGTLVTGARPEAAASTYFGGNYASKIETGSFTIDSSAVAGASSVVSMNWGGVTSGIQFDSTKSGNSGKVSASGSAGASDLHGYFGYVGATLSIALGSNPLITLKSSSIPAGYGSTTLGSTTVPGSHASGYQPGPSITLSSATSGAVEVKGIDSRDDEYFGLKLAGVTASGSTSLSQIISTINSSGVGVSASDIAHSQFANFSPFSADNLLLKANGVLSADQFLGFDFSSLNGISVSEIDAVPEPASLGLLGLGGLAMLRRRRSNSNKRKGTGV